MTTLFFTFGRLNIKIGNFIVLLALLQYIKHHNVVIMCTRVPQDWHQYPQYCHSEGKSNTLKTIDFKQVDF